MILAGRVIDAACIALIFLAQQALRITALLCQFRRCDGLWILLRLGKVDRNVKRTLLCVRGPF